MLFLHSPRMQLTIVKCNTTDCCKTSDSKYGFEWTGVTELHLNIIPVRI